ncbi:hypothetical protein EV586_104222 [Tumebacillus sp. BK434]|uniref:hypothetical protein n=1 Tax=Tumebacillus sp. BK434 TaxID=2512169 RepID=UPI00104EA588|nr:hypothetical protein [Tumebacillus sp. BK434]TCP54601.1 hypothetical protein EV586_104222 [Tumebacillus sp. BK434]
MRKTMLALCAAAWLLVGCAQKTESPPPTTPPPASNQGETGGQGTTPEPNGGAANPAPVAEKTEEQTKGEIREKLARMTDPKTGYVLPNDNGVVQEVTTLPEVTEKLRKKGYSLPLAQTLTEEFFKEQTRGGTTQVVIIPRGGHPGVFQPEQAATFTKKGKWIWVIEQDHDDNLLHGPHISSYEVEVLKDGTYRLNTWTNKFL